MIVIVCIIVTMGLMQVFWLYKKAKKMKQMEEMPKYSDKGRFE